MEKTYRDIMIASTVEILCLPLFYSLYEPEYLRFFFWVLLFALDSFMLKRLPFFELMKLYTQEGYKKERRQIIIMEVIFFVGLVILAFKNISLAGIVLLNDVIVDFLCFITAMNEKKNK